MIHNHGGGAVFVESDRHHSRDALGAPDHHDRASTPLGKCPERGVIDDVREDDDAVDTEREECLERPDAAIVGQVELGYHQVISPFASHGLHSRAGLGEMQVSHVDRGDPETQ